MNKQYVGNVIVDNIDQILADMDKKTVLEPGLSFVIRAKNEELSVAQCIQSIVDIADEIIFVDNNSADKTLEIALLLADKHPNLYVYRYNIDVPRAGTEHENAVNKNMANTLATYYNWCLSKVTKFNVIKWDCDFIPLKENLVKMIDKYSLKDRDDYFSVWFTGKTLFHGQYLRENDYYDEYRIFSKKNGFKWENYRGCETAAYYVWNCPKCYINGFVDKFSDVQHKNFDSYKKCSPPVFFEVKTRADLKDITNILDKRDVQDNKILEKTIEITAFDVLRNITRIINTEYKILITLPSLTLGGGNVWAINIYKNLVSIGFNVKIFCGYISKQTTENVYMDSFDPSDIITNMGENELYDYITIHHIKYIIQTSNVFSSKYLSILKKDTMLYVLSHSDISYINDYILKNKHYFNKIITVNHLTIEKFSQYGIDNTLFLSNYLTNLPYCDNKQITKKFGIISRLSFDKNIIMTLYAFKEILPKYPEYQFHIVGNDTVETTEMIQSYIKKLDLEKNVIIHGYQKNVVGFYHQFDFIILPSVSEGCSYNLLEAALTGTPIICSNVGGNKEIVRDHAVLFQLNGINDLSNSLLSVNNYDDHLKLIGYKLSTDDQILMKITDATISPLPDTSLTDFIERMVNWKINVSNIMQAICRMIDGYSFYLTQRKLLYESVRERFSSKKVYFNQLMDILELHYKII